MRGLREFMKKARLKNAVFFVLFLLLASSAYADPYSCDLAVEKVA